MKHLDIFLKKENKRGEEGNDKKKEAEAKKLCIDFQKHYKGCFSEENMAPCDASVVKRDVDINDNYVKYRKLILDKCKGGSKVATHFCSLPLASIVHSCSSIDLGCDLRPWAAFVIVFLGGGATWVG